jgi:hypothetical protein
VKIYVGGQDVTPYVIFPEEALRRWQIKTMTTLRAILRRKRQRALYPSDGGKRRR